MPPSDLDDQLKAFLEWQERERAEGVTLKSLHHTIAGIADHQGKHELEDQTRHKEVMEKFVTYERRLQANEVDVEKHKTSIADHDKRLVGVEKDAQHLTSDVKRVDADVDRLEEKSGQHDLAAIQAAAARVTLPDIPPPPTPPRTKSIFARALAAESSKAAGKILLVVATLVIGWLAHHFTINFRADPPPSFSPDASSR
jgi:hypothetical protein